MSTYGNYSDKACRYPEAKQHTRELPLQIVREHSSTLWDHTRNTLGCDWMELAGAEAPTFPLLLKAGALQTGKFIGVDTEESTIQGCRQTHGETHATWIHNPLKTVLVREEYAPIRKQVGVLVYDSHDGLYTSKNSLHHKLQPLFAFAKSQRENLSEFLLVINLVADPRYVKGHHWSDYCDIINTEMHPNEPLTRNHILEYTSKAVPMAWVAITSGF
jgi:hypothetical protein